MPPLASDPQSPKIPWLEAGEEAKIMVRFRANSPNETNIFPHLLPLRSSESHRADVENLSNNLPVQQPYLLALQA